jgi:predicted DsbA family dithiol-disulfide isomerase
MQTVKVEIVSDVMCPWCFNRQRRLEAALRELPGGIEGGDSLEALPARPDAHQNRQGSPAISRREVRRARAGAPNLRPRRGGRCREGIPFDFVAIEVSANTLDAHRLIRWAGAIDAQTQDRLVEALFRTYFIEAATSETTTFSATRGRSGSRPRMGVTGVPCFIIDNKYAVTGAQSLNVLVNPPSARSRR